MALLPQLSICDEDVLDTLFDDLVTNNASFDGTKFGPTLKLLQDRYDCLGIHCSLVGTSTSSDSSWPVCVDTTDPKYIPNIAGYRAFSKSSAEYSKIDLDVSTILSFIVMEVSTIRATRIMHECLKLAHTFVRYFSGQQCCYGRL